MLTKLNYDLKNEREKIVFVCQGLLPHAVFARELIAIH